MNKTQVAEKRYREKQNKEDYKIYNIQIKKKQKHNKITKEKATWTNSKTKRIE